MAEQGVMATPVQTGPQTTQVGSFDRSNAVLVLGLVLLGVNLYLTPEWQNVLRGGLGLAPRARTDTSPAPISLVDLMLQGLVVLLLWGLAKTGEEAGNLALLFLVALWLGWFVTNGPHLAAALGLSSVGQQAGVQVGQAGAFTGSIVAGHPPAAV